LKALDAATVVPALETGGPHARPALSLILLATLALAATAASVHLQHVRAATGRSEKALERTFERLGPPLSTPPPRCCRKAYSCRSAAQAVEHVVNLARGLGLGR
jgi:hypothetical protein